MKMTKEIGDDKCNICSIAGLSLCEAFPAWDICMLCLYTTAKGEEDR